MKNVEFTIVDGDNHPLHEPAVIEREADLPVALMEAVNDFLEAYDGKLTLPLRIQVTDARPKAA
ncbi:MAG: hypothetical protein WDN28_14915 [Chthoniobacter sp.]